MIRQIFLRIVGVPLLLMGVVRFIDALTKFQLAGMFWAFVGGVVGLYLVLTGGSDV